VSARIIPMRRPEGRAAEMSDEALLAACAVADNTALTALFDRHHLRVHRFLTRLTGARPVEIEDLLQDTFTSVWSAASRYRGQAPALTWIFGRHEALRRIERVLEALPHDLRVAFVLCDLEGISGVDAARTLGVRPGTVWRRLHEARKELRARLEEGRR
jgi:DNA-directed RNA polymerase specialized sigma24 family protein